MNKSVWVVIEVLLKIYLNDKLKSSAIFHPIGATKPRAETWRTKRYGERGTGVFPLQLTVSRLAVSFCEELNDNGDQGRSRHPLTSRRAILFFTLPLSRLGKHAFA